MTRKTPLRNGLLRYDSLEDAIIGIGERCGQPRVLVYSQSGIFYILLKRDNMTLEEAMDYFYYNIHGGWLGEKTPILLMDITDGEEDEDEGD